MNRGDYEGGYRRGYLEGVRAAALHGPKVVGGDRLWRLMQTPEHLMRMAEWALSSIRGEWRGLDAFIVCGGPSLVGFDWGRLEDQKTIAVNRVPLKVKSPFVPDFLLVNDLHLWAKYEEQSSTLNWLIESGTRLVSQPSAFFEYEIPRGFWYEPVPDIDRLIKEVNGLFMHATVAAAAIHLAQILGAKRVFLLGLDGYTTKERTYFWGEEHRQAEEFVHERAGVFIEDRMAAWSKDMVSLKTYFERHHYMTNAVFNLNPRSQVEGWPRIDPKEVFGDAHADAREPVALPAGRGRDEAHRGAEVGGEELRSGDPAVQPGGEGEVARSDEARGVVDVGDQGGGGAGGVSG